MSTWQRLADIPDHITEVTDGDGDRVIRSGGHWRWVDRQGKTFPSCDAFGPFAAPDAPKETPVATTPEMPEGYLVDASQTRLDGVRVRCVPLLGDSSGRAPAIVGTSEPGHIREVAAALLAYADQQDRERAEQEQKQAEREKLIFCICLLMDWDNSEESARADAARIIDAGWRPGGAQ